MNGFSTKSFYKSRIFKRKFEDIHKSNDDCDDYFQATTTELKKKIPRKSVFEAHSDIYRVFQKQCDALKFAEEHKTLGLMTFSFELDANGRRNYFSERFAETRMCDYYLPQEYIEQ